MFEDDDEEDFAVSKSSNLSGIFGKLEDYEAKRNPSLKYSAPKQPKKNNAMDSKSSSKSSGPLGVIHTAVVNAYKFDDGKYAHQGKLGLAILGNYDLRSFMLLMYRDKKNTITKVTINLHFNFIVQENNYANFYDDQRVNWSVNFENVLQCQMFSQELCLAKFNSSAHHLESPIVQDLSIGSGPAVHLGHVIEAKYSCWFLTEQKFGQEFFSSNEKTKSLKVGDSRLIDGFDTFIQNINRGGVRMLVLQSHHDQKDLSNEFTIPEKTTVALKVEVFFEEKISSKSSSPSPVPDKPSIPSKPSLSSLGDDSSVKARCASLSEQLQSSPKLDKAKIISRMAKMGQPMVPVQSTSASKLLSSESDTEDDRHLQADVHPTPTPRVKTKNIVQKPDSFPGNNSSMSSGFTPLNSSTNMYSAQSLALCQPQPMLSPFSSNQPMMPIAQSGAPYAFLPGQSYIANNPHDSHMPVLLSEVRTQNTEMRMQVSQMAEKLDRVLEKVGQTVAYPNMEVGTLSENIRRIFEENENLKEKTKEKDIKIEVLSEKVNSLLHRNQIILEKSNSMLEQRSNQMQLPSLESTNRITLLEQEKSKLLEELSETKVAATDLKRKLQSFENSNANLQKEFEMLNEANNLKENAQEKCDLLKKEAEKLKSSLDIATEKLKDEEEKCNHLEKQLNLLTQNSERFINLKVDYDKIITEKSHLHNEIENLKTLLEDEKKKSSLTDKEKTPVQGPFIEEIKKVMNAVYRNLTKEFVPDRNYTGGDIKSTLAAAIRQTTLDVIEHYSEKSAPIETAVKSDSIESAVESEAIVETIVKAISSEAKVVVDDVIEKNETPTEISNSENVISPIEKVNQAGIITETSDAVKQDDEEKSNEPEDGFKSFSVTDEFDDSFIEPWRPQPPPFFDESNSDEEDWLK